MLARKFIASRLTAIIYLLIKRHSKSAGRQKFISLFSEPVELFITVIIVYFAFDRLEFPAEWNLVSKHEFGLRLVLERIFHLALIFSSFWITLRSVDFIALIFSEKARVTETKADDQLVHFVKEAVKVIIVAIGFLVILGVAFQLDIVSLITGLGIGGLAIALAAKETLENLLGSFTIFLDKPFVAGDTVKVGNIEGVVESVGFRSTRIRALDKMMVTVPNKKMIDAELINDTDRTVRRITLSFLLSYETSEEQLKKILLEIKTMLHENKMVEDETENVRFRKFHENGLEILINCIVLTPDPGEFLEIQEELNFQVLKIVNANRAQFAIPSLYKNESNENKSPAGLYKTLSSGNIREVRE